MQLPGLAVGDLDDGEPQAAKDFKVDARIPTHLGNEADEKYRDLDAALDQRACHDESVATVVAAAAQDGHASLEQLAVDGFDCRHHLPAGVFHQHQRRNANLFNRPAIGLAHLRGIQHAHESKGSTTEDAEDTEASYYST